MGSFKILEEGFNHIYKLNLSSSWRISKNFHNYSLKLYYASEIMENSQLSAEEEEDKGYQNILQTEITSQSDTNTRGISEQLPSSIRKHSLQKCLKRISKKLPKRD